jgi:hypothetical protein
MSSHRGHRAVGHAGRWGGYVSQLTRYPDQRLSVAVLCNRSDAYPDAYATRVADIFLPVVGNGPQTGALAALPDVSLPRNALPLLTGTFRGDAPEMTTVEDQGRLYVAFEGQQYELRHLGSYRFEMLQGPAEVAIQFDVVGNEPASSFQWQGVRGSFAMTRVTRPETTLSVAALQEYAGRYFSEELQSTIEITATDGGLVVRGPGISSRVFPNTAPDEFTSGLSVRFTRGPGGSISGFALSSNRSRTMRFEKVVRVR